MNNALEGWFFNQLNYLNIFGIMASVFVFCIILWIYGLVNSKDMLVAISYLLFMIWDCQIFLEELSHL